MIVKGIRILNTSLPVYVDDGVKELSTHAMLAFTGFSDNLEAWVQKQKDAGYTNIWAYADYYLYEYPERMIELLDACEAVGGITVSPGSHGANSFENRDAELIEQTINHPAIYKINGKPVYTYYQWSRGYWLQNTLPALTAAGINRSDFLLIVNNQYTINANYEGTIAAQFAAGTITSPYYRANTNQTFYYFEGNVYLENVSTTPSDLSGVEYMYKRYEIDGLVNFAVDKSKGQIITENQYISQGADSLNKIAQAGFSGFYASVSFQDHGFDGIADQLNGILGLPVDERPKMLSTTTADDYVELSYTSSLLTPAVNGLAYMPEIASGFTLGSNTRFVLTDHTGIEKFARPWMDAYLNNQAIPTFSTNKIFAWYWLHPVDAPIIPTVPANVTALGAQFTQEYWATTVYGLENAHNVYGIKTNLATQVGKIRMAAHLTAPSYLRIVINGTTYTSPLRSAGAAYWECPQALGTPVFSIIASNGTTVLLTATGSQAITNSCYPGGWNFLAEEPVTNS